MIKFEIEIDNCEYDNMNKRNCIQIFNVFLGSTASPCSSIFFIGTKRRLYVPVNVTLYYQAAQQCGLTELFSRCPNVRKIWWIYPSDDNVQNGSALAI